MPAWRRGWSCRVGLGAAALVLLAAACSSGPGSSPGPGSSSAAGASGAGAGPSPDLALQSPRPFPPATRARLQALVDRYRLLTTAPGVLAGVWSPRGTWVSATGVADLSTGAPMSATMQYKITSQTKTFTADLILQLASEHKLSLSDRLSRWIPGVADGSRVTIRELLNHTGGFADVRNGEESGSPLFQQKMTGKGCTEAELLAPTQPLFPPGTRWRYSNYGMDLLGRIAELATGKSLSTLIRERITVPLHLTRTYLPASGSGLTTPYMHGYVSSKQQPAPVDATGQQFSTCGWAAGGMVSTLADMRVWSVALGTGQLLQPAVWAAALQNQVPVPTAFNTIDIAVHASGTYGLGFQGFAGFIGHQGNGPGYDSATYYSPALHLTVAVVSNGQANAARRPPVPPSATSLAQALAMAATGRSLGFGLSPAQVIAPLSRAEILQVLPGFRQYMQAGG